jgi:TPR repeat protein
MMQHLTPILVPLQHDPKITPLFKEGLKHFCRGEAKFALPYFTEVANGYKYPPALLFLGLMYSKGIGVHIDLAMSTKLNRDAALQLLDLGIHLQHPQLQTDLGTYRCVDNDYDRALEHFHSAARMGYMNELFKLGSIFQIGVEVLPNPAVAVACYIAAAQQGHIEAQYHLALHFYNGFGVEQNFEAAAHWFLNAAEKGHTDAQSCSGNLFLQGIGVPKSESKAVRYFFKAAEKNHPLALRHLGYCFLFGYGVQKELKEANFWFSRAALQGDEVSQQFLHQHPPESWNNRTGYERACKWFKPSLSTKNTTIAVNKTSAVTIERKSNSQGLIGRHKNKNQAPSNHVVYTILKPNRSAPSQPNTPVETKASTTMQNVQNSAVKNPIHLPQKTASTILQQLHQAEIEKFLRPAVVYDKNTAFIRKLIIAETAPLHQNSIRAGSLSPKNDSEAQYRLALHYLELGFLNKAKHFLEKAAHKNHLEAQYVLGMGYLQFGYTRQGRAWLENIAEQGHKPAQSVLNYLLNPNNTPSNSRRQDSQRFFNPKNQIEFPQLKLLTLESKNTPEFDILNANIVFSEEDKQQWAKIHYLFGRKFFDGAEGFKQSYVNAAKQFQQAAELNYPDAQYRYALCFLKGHGVKKCKNTAMEWFAKASVNNHLKAKNELEKLKNPGKKLTTKESSIVQKQQSSKKEDRKPEIPQEKPQIQSNSSEQNTIENPDFLFETLQEKIYFFKALNNPQLAYDLAYKYYMGNVLKRDYKKAIKLFKTVADTAKNCSSLFYVGDCYNMGGFGINKDEQKANENFSKAYEQFIKDARSGIPQANYFLGHYYLFGYGRKRELDRALNYFLKAEEGGFSNYENHYYMGLCYQQMGTHESLQQAALWMSKAATAGKAEAQVILQELSKHGITVDTFSTPLETKSEIKNASSNSTEMIAEKSIEQQAAAINDLVIPEQKTETPDAAIIEEEYLHKIVKLIALDQYKNAEPLLLKLIRDHKYPPAYIYMATVSGMQGKDASSWYTLAKKFEPFFLEESEDPLRKFYTGLYYATVLKKEDIAFDYFKAASDSGISRAQVFMSHYYLNNKSIHFNSAKGIATLRSAVEKGKTEARMFIINFFKSQHMEVFKELEAGALNGEPYSQFGLGVYYYESNDIPNKYEKAMSWFIKAANLGQIHANYYLSLCYFLGKGTAPNLKTALDLAKMVLSQGFKPEKAQKLINDIEAMSAIINIPVSAATETVSKLDTKSEAANEKKAANTRNKPKDVNLQSNSSSGFFANSQVAEHETATLQPLPKMD